MPDGRSHQWKIQTVPAPKQGREIPVCSRWDVVRYEGIRRQYGPYIANHVPPITQIGA